MNKWYLGLAMVTTLLGCSQSIDVEREQQILLDTDIAFADASFEKGAAEAFREFLAEDALELPDGELPLVGREAIYAALSEDPQFDLTWQPEEAVVARSGDLGYTWGTFWSSWADENGNPVASEGKYLNIWRKEGDGRWRVIVDMGNQNP